MTESNILDHAYKKLSIPEEYYQQVETIIHDNYVNNGIACFDYSKYTPKVTIRHIYAIVRSCYRHNFTSYDIESYEFRGNLTPKEYGVIKRVYNEGWLYFADCLLRGEKFAEKRYNKIFLQTNKETIKVNPKNLDINSFINKHHETLKKLKEKVPIKKKKKKRIRFEKEEDKGGIIKEKLKLNLKAESNKKSRKKRIKRKHSIRIKNQREAEREKD